jgi:hypothetical protein
MNHMFPEAVTLNPLLQRIRNEEYTLRNGVVQVTGTNSYRGCLLLVALSAILQQSS